MWTYGSHGSYPLTFVCVVINDYFVGVSPRRVSQFLYGLSKFDGSVLFQTRVGVGDTTIEWGKWKDINEDKIDKKINDAVNTLKVKDLGFNSNGVFLDSLVDEGLYRGGYYDGGVYKKYALTVIDNNYQDVHTISQFMQYNEPYNGDSFFVERHKAGSNGVWTDWQMVNKKEISDLVASEMNKIIEGTEPDTIDSIKDLVAWVEEHGKDAANMATAIKANTTAIANEETRAKAEEAELEKLLTGTSVNMGNGANYPFVYVSKSLNDLVDGALHTYLNEFTPYTSNNKVYNTGIYRIGSIGGSSFITVTNHSFNWNTYVYVQVVEGPVAITSEGLATIHYNTYGKYYRYSSKGSDGNLVWKAWKGIDEANTNTAIQNKVGILNKAYPNSNAGDNGAKELPFPIKAGDIVSIIGPEGWTFGYLFFDANRGDYSKYVALQSMKDGKLLNYKIPTGKGDYVTHCKFSGDKNVWQNATFSFFSGNDTLSEVVHDNYDQLSTRIEQLEQQLAKLTAVQ